MNKNSIIALFLISLLASCFKEEDPRDKFTTYVTVGLGSDYGNQIFYSLSDTQVISSNKYEDWNLSFYCGNDASYIRLNAAANMWVERTNQSDFDADYSYIINDPDPDKKFDGSHGLTNDLAINVILDGFSEDTLTSNQNVFLVHPGRDANGIQLGNFKKLVFKGIFQDSYLIRYADLDGSEEVNLSIPKNELNNFVCLSWNTNDIVSIEPDKISWDIVFSRFTDTANALDGSDLIEIGYSVTGAYLNQANVEAYAINGKAYEDVSISDYNQNLLESRLNIIGHNWKRFVGSQFYIVDNRTYIIKDRNGILLKMRFLGFYDTETAEKGYPSFEFELL